ncbi:MAG TPA: hypothetical protein VF723_05810 [Pyrinomonadaceae bacterium]|jgi:hypothetical protein
MRNGHKFLGAGVLLALMLAGTQAFAQKPRTGDDPVGTAAAARPTPPAPPQTFKAKYEGGIFGLNKREEGTLTFDDANHRLVFRNKQQVEVASIPYASVSGAFADTQSRRPTSASVIGSLPLPYGANIPALFIKKKYRYLTLQFSDPDTRVAGVTSFKVENKQILDSVLYALGNKAGLEQRGEAFIRRKELKVPAPEM